MLCLRRDNCPPIPHWPASLENGTGGLMRWLKPQKYVEPFGYLECYLAFENAVGYLDNYEATTDHFPIRYRNSDLPADYLVVWQTQYHQSENLKSRYDLIAKNSYNRLYQRKKKKPDTLLWGNNQKDDEYKV